MDHMDITANWGWPQWAVFLLMAVSLFADATLHGKPRTGNYNGIGAIIAAALNVFVLYCGGFFR